MKKLIIFIFACVVTSLGCKSEKAKQIEALQNSFDSLLIETNTLKHRFNVESEAGHIDEAALLYDQRVKVYNEMVNIVERQIDINKE